MSNSKSQDNKIHINLPYSADILKVASFISKPDGYWVPFCTICEKELSVGVEHDESLHNPVDLC